MDWPLIRFLAVIFCLVGVGVGLGYMMVTPQKMPGEGIAQNR